MTSEWPSATSRTIGNGLTVVTVRLPHLHTASVALYVRVGSRYEAAADSGLSHLLEHVLFRGCEGYPDTYAFNAALEAICTGLDAATSRDFTSFEATSSPDNVPEVLRLIGAMVSAPTLEGVEIERRVIREELQDELDTAGRDVDVENVSKAALFRGSSMALKVGGRIERVMTFTEADCRRWLERHYGARNMVLVVAGPFDHQAVRPWAEAAFGRLRAGTLVVAEAARGRRDLPALEYVRGSGPQADVQLSWVVPGEGHEDWPALLLMQRILDDGSCAKLRHRLVDQLALAYHAGVDLEVYDGCSVVTVDTQTRQRQVVQVVDEIVAILDALRAAPVDEEPFERARARLCFDLSAIRDSTAGAAHWFGLQHLCADADTLERRVARVMRVTAADVTRAACVHVDPARMQLAVVGDVSPLDRAALRRRVHRIRARSPTAAEASPTRRP